MHPEPFDAVSIRIQPIDWQSTMALRQQVLWPQKPAEHCRLEGDETANHYGAFCADHLLGVASVFTEDSSARLRKFATAKEHQGKGVGTVLLGHIMEELTTRGYRYFWCDARETAIGFYRRFGLEVESDRFYKSGVAHVKMGTLLG